MSDKPDTRFGEPTGDTCVCGCGEPTTIGFNGTPNRWVLAHRKRKPGSIKRPNPDGLCMCGCGEVTPKASRSTSRTTKGEHIRYAYGHLPLTAEGDYAERPETGCWEWRKTVHDTGYGVVTRAGVRHFAHRLYYSLHCGEIPAGHDVHHTCRNRLCVNPTHLEALTRAEHVRADRALREAMACAA